MLDYPEWGNDYSGDCGGSVYSKGVVFDNRSKSGTVLWLRTDDGQLKECDVERQERLRQFWEPKEEVQWTKRKKENVHDPYGLQLFKRPYDPNPWDRFAEWSLREKARVMGIPPKICAGYLSITETRQIQVGDRVRAVGGMPASGYGHRADNIADDAVGVVQSINDDGYPMVEWPTWKWGKRNRLSTVTTKVPDIVTLTTIRIEPI